MLSTEQNVQECPSLPQDGLATDDDLPAGRQVVVI